MKAFQRVMRVIILIGSLGGFLSGWSLLAHAQKPETIQVPELNIAPTPLPRLNFNSTQPIAPRQVSPQTGVPRLRTRGS